MKIPGTFQAGDSVTFDDDAWYDAQNKRYDSGSYTLSYVLVGPSNPLTINASAKGQGWTTTISTTQSAALTAGTWFWTAYMNKTGERVTAGQGELTVTPNMAAITASYDGRSLAEKALAAAEAAYSTFNSSNGMVKKYTIGGREMEFQDAGRILEIISYWRAQVRAQQKAKMIAQGLGNPDEVYVRFN